MNILGISCYYHDSAVTLISNGDIVAAIQEERFTRIKNDNSFPINSIKYCINQIELKKNKIDIIVFYENPYLKINRIKNTVLHSSPWGLKQFIEIINSKSIIKNRFKKDIINFMGYKWKGKIFFSEHHLSHSASAFYPSPFIESAILTLDGVGEWSTGTIGYGNNNSIKVLKETVFPHSLGLLYSSFTYFCGFSINKGEYKLMGLASYGKPIYKKIILNNLIEVKNDGSFKLNMRYFDFMKNTKMINSKFENLFEKKTRLKTEKITAKDKNIAASIQSITEDIVINSAKYSKKITGSKNLCMAGGVALNCVANGKLLEKKIFDNIWIQPASGDAGGSLGAALNTWNEINETRNEKHDLMKGSYLGPSYSNYYIRNILNSLNVEYKELEEKNLLKEIIEFIINQKIIGYFRGKMEFGPRALGSRSILADPRNPNMKMILNSKIKKRELFRPFGPSVMEEYAKEIFNINNSSPYMLFTAYVRKKYQKSFPAIIHQDNSSRIQTCNLQQNGFFYKIIKEFYKKTGCPMLINTSFNKDNEPIVCSPQDAYNCFISTNIDVLIIENFIIKK